MICYCFEVFGCQKVTQGLQRIVIKFGPLSVRGFLYGIIQCSINIDSLGLTVVLDVVTALLKFN